MANARVEDEIEAPIGAVWACFADFGDLRAWAPGAPRVELDGPGDRVGTVRAVQAEGQPSIRERLESYDAAAGSFSYAILESPFPFTDYVATVRLREAGAARTAIVWSSVFEPRGLPAERTVDIIEGMYRMFIGKLKETLAA